MKLLRILIFTLVSLSAGISIVAESGTVPVARHGAAAESAGLSGKITLQDALNAAYSCEPELAAHVIEVERNVSLEEQAGKWLNPALAMGAEGFGGNGAHQGTGVMETRIGLSQEFELGGKPGKRSRAARHRTAIARAELEEKRRSLETMVKSRFAGVFTAQQTFQIQQDNLDLVRSSHSIISELVRAGEVSPLLEDQAAVELAAAENALLQAEQDLQKARLELAATWNSFNPEFTAVQGEFFDLAELPSLEILLQHLEDHPRARKWEAERLRRQAELELAKSKIWPNLEIGGGYQKFRESSEHSYYLELRVPIPLLNRNQGDIKAAVAGTRIAQRREQFALLQLKNQAAGLFLDITAVRAELVSITETLLPAARKAFDAVSEAFRLGEEEYMSVIDAQRQLLDSKRRQARLTARFFDLKARLEGLTGKPLD